jgi:UDP-sulfoquinovose synthase
MRVLVLGGDGYLGWPTAMSLSAQGHQVSVADSLVKRAWERELGVAPLVAVPPLETRVAAWAAVSGRRIEARIGDLTEYPFVSDLVASVQPEAIVHYAEQPSAPYSMLDCAHAVSTQVNNIAGTLNLVFALRDHCPEAHLVKLGTMGEYGTPNIDIEEGFLEVEWKGRRDTLPFPKSPGSFYHLSKVHDSHNLLFAARVWGLRVTELNQGIVYGIETDETAADPRLVTSFHYDAVFGTVLNRFCVQAVLGRPLTVYGKGGQTRGFLHIRDTLRAVELAIAAPPPPGTLRVFNQFAELFSVGELAEAVRQTGAELGLDVRVDSIDNPRVESERHYYHASNQGLRDLGFEPRLLSGALLREMLRGVARHREGIDPVHILPAIDWRGGGPGTA